MGEVIQPQVPVPLMAGQADAPALTGHDWSKLQVDGGRIHFFMYQQDGLKQPWAIPDTLSNRHFVEWVQIHDSPLPGRAA